jgi:hypothetical protein
MGTFTITYTLQVDTISIREWHDYFAINGNASKLLRAWMAFVASTRPKFQFFRVS